MLMTPGPFALSDYQITLFAPSEIGFVSLVLLFRSLAIRLMRSRVISADSATPGPQNLPSPPWAEGVRKFYVENFDLWAARKL